MIHSLGYRTDLIFPRFEGRVEDRGEYLVIATPENPGFHWGNFLLFRAAPTADDVTRWPALFRREFGHEPRVRHLAFGWDAPDGAHGAAAEFVAAGFQLDEAVVLATDAVRATERCRDDLAVRPIAGDSEWDAALRNQVACRAEGFEEGPYVNFKRRQMARYRCMTDAGTGAWFGAFMGDRLVGDLGVFLDEGGKIGRFQSVGTHPMFRRSGVCATLVYRASEMALARMGAEVLVMVADAHEHALRIYESVGFERAERQIGVSWWPARVGH